MKLYTLASLFFILSSVTALAQEIPGESPYIKNYRKMCQTDYNQRCSNDGLNRLKVTFPNDRDKRVFYVTNVDIQKTLAFMSEQETKKAASGGPTAGEQAIDYIQEMEFQRNTIAMLQYSCVGLAGTCAYIGGKFGQINKWLIVVYGACLTAGASCTTYGNDATKRYDEEIKQIKEACKDGADPEACVARIEKGEHAKLLPADNPSPALGIGSGGSTGDGSGDQGTIGQSPEVWTTPGMVCVNNTIIMEGGPLGQKIGVPETNCYVL